MKRTDLVKGGTYVLQRPDVKSAVFEGEHDGVLSLADGSKFWGGARSLRFRYTDADGTAQVALLEDGGSVVETTATREAREAAEQAKKDRVQAALVAATEYLRDHGFALAHRWSDVGPESVELRADAESVDEVQITLSVGKLKAIARGVVERLA